MKVIFCVVLFTLAAVAKAELEYPLPDYYDNNYDTYDTYNDALDDGNENTEVKEPEKIQQSQVLDVQEQADAQKEPDKDEFADYQIEDNRSESTEKDQVEENKEEIAEEIIPEVPVSEEAELHKVLPLELPEQSNEEFQELGLSADAVVDDDVAPLPVPETEDINNGMVLEDNEDSLNQGQDYLDDLNQLSPVDNVNDDKDMDKIFEETKKLLAENDDTFDGKDYETSSAQLKSGEDVLEVEEDTAAKAYADLHADLDKLIETFDKLGVDKSNENSDTDEEAADDNKVEDYEEKYGKPYKEDIALSWRNAEADAAELVESKNDNTAEENNDEVVEENVVLDEAADKVDDDYEVIDDSNLSKIFAENANITNENDTKETSINKLNEIMDYLDDTVEPADSEPNADDDIDSVIKQIFDDDVKEPKETQTYGNDALVDEKHPTEADAVEFEAVEMKTTNAGEDITQKTVMVDDLNSAEFSDLMSQFVVGHKENFDVNSENLAEHVMPIRVTLSVDKPTVIKSPGYPENYEINNIVEWIFDGPGTGIELNITDLDLNGIVGDYLLVKPGGIDESGTDGLIFSYHLNSPRKYRFADVNRMFVKFQSFGSSPMRRGFTFSVKLIWPLPTFDEDEPEAEPLLNPPEETLTLNLAGLTLVKFLEIKDQFLELLADMAKDYIRDHNISLGLNTTHEVTQITRTAVCNIQWPEYENCVEVTFGVPLHYDEELVDPRLSAEELDDMWTNYIVKERFSERLRSLGITEYAIPNDRTVLMVWLVIAGGVVISMAMLAFALWRFSCFEDYTRMQTYGDTDSIQNEKRHLDLYPTPHQTLPPLYSENDYKWADDKYDDSTRVDMGGFANRSYVRDDLFDLDSDEDVITPRDRYTTNV